MAVQGEGGAPATEGEQQQEALVRLPEELISGLEGAQYLQNMHPKASGRIGGH